MNIKHVILSAILAIFSTTIASAGDVSVDPNAITVRGDHQTVTLEGWVRGGKYHMSNGSQMDAFYIHLYVPVNWYPDPAKPEMEPGLTYHSVFHAYDIQLDSMGGTFKALDESMGKRCVAVVGEINTNEYNPAPGTEPFALAMVVSKVRPCNFKK